MLFDTHVHFDDFVKDGSLPDVLDRAEASAVSKMMAMGGDPEANELAQTLAQRFPNRIYAAVGYNRDLVDSFCDLPALRELAAKETTVAIGETGLDYFYAPEKAKEQQGLFLECLDIAAQVRKPVSIHTREADDDTRAILTDFSNGWKGEASRIGVIHCFTRDEAFAKAMLDRGFYISFSGIVTFRNADSLCKVVNFIPEDRLLIETDSPYLAPVPHRGKRCEPAWVVHTLKRLAELRGSTLECLAKRTTQNALHLFGCSN